MKVVNLFAGPGVGKSVMAADIFSVIKKNGGSAELAGEYAKDMVYESRMNILTDQVYVLAKQNRRLHRLRDKVDWVISDSPLLLSPVYAPADYYPSFVDLAFDVFDSYENINLFLQRPADRIYQDVGRTQKAAEAIEFDDKIKNFLDQHRVPYKVVHPGRDIVDFNFLRIYLLSMLDSNLVAA
jgi:hypothetical protein